MSWYTDDGTFENEYQFTVMPAESLTVYAKWYSYTDGLEYEFTDGQTAYTVSGINDTNYKEIIIPENYNGLPVTSIGLGAFQNCIGLASITIPDSLIFIYGMSR